MRKLEVGIFALIWDHFCALRTTSCDLLSTVHIPVGSFICVSQVNDSEAVPKNDVNGGEDDAHQVRLELGSSSGLQNVELLETGACTYIISICWSRLCVPSESPRFLVVY